MKQCDHCYRRFKNRQNLRAHLISFHDCLPIRVKDPVTTREGKPHRRVRMAMQAARVKKARDNVARASIGTKLSLKKRAIGSELKKKRIADGIRG